MVAECRIKKQAVFRPVNSSSPEQPKTTSAGQRILTEPAQSSRRAGGGRCSRLGAQHKQRARRPDAKEAALPTKLGKEDAERATGPEGVLRTMAANLTQANVQERACKALSELASTADAQSKIASLGGIEAALKAMETHFKVAYVQLAGSSALNKMCERHEKNTLDLVARRGIDAIAEAMKEHKAMQQLQELGCRAVKNAAACNSECQSKVASVGIAAVLGAMTAHTNAAAVQEAGCQALKELAVHNVVNQEQIVLNGGVQVVLRAMETHSTLPSIQMLGCGVLRNITVCSADHQENVVSRGGVATVLDAMTKHMENADVQWAGCWALFCMVVHNPAMQVEVAAHGAVKATLKAMQEHRAESRVQEAGCWMLKEMAQHVAAGQSTLPAALQAVTKAMEKHPASTAVQTGAGNALRKLAEHDKKGWVKTMCLGRCGRLGQTATRQMLSAIEE